MTDNSQQQGVPQPARNQADEDRKTRELTDKVGGFIKDGAFRTGTGVKLVWHDPLLFVKIIDSMIDWARKTFPQELLNVVSRFFSRIGFVSLLAAAPLGLLFGITVGIKSSSFSNALYGLGFVLLMLIVQYAASKLLVAGEALTMAATTTMESDAFLRCVAVIVKTTGIVSIVYMTTLAIQLKDWSSFWSGVGILTLCQCLYFIALHPALASTSIVERSSPGEEAIGIISFFVKAAMRLVPIVFGLSAFATLVQLAIATVQLFRDKADMVDGMRLATTLVYTALLPFVAYVGFALYCLSVELMRAILSIKGISKKCD